VQRSFCILIQNDLAYILQWLQNTFNKFSESSNLYLNKYFIEHVNDMPIAQSTLVMFYKATYCTGERFCTQYLV